MKAIVYKKYGSPDVLELREVEKPTPKDGEVLIEVHAVSLNGSDWEILTGKPLYARFRGFLKPRHTVLGSDVAGRVEAVGRGATRFQPGDEVFGDIMVCMGGFAEYVSVPQNALTRKPAGMTYEEVACLPQGACIALQGICDKERVRPEDKVLINGGGGSAGAFAIQIAKSLGAEVTGVDNAGKLDLMRSIGADHVIDYTQEDFTRNGRHYDLILDLKAYHSIRDYHRALSPRGIYLMVGGSVALLLRLLFLGPLISMFGGKKLGILGLRPNKDLADIIELCEAGTMVPVIDKRYPLDEVPEALRYLGEGRALGKVVITLESDRET